LSNRGRVVGSQGGGACLANSFEEVLGFFLFSGFSKLTPSPPPFVHQYSYTK
jgi:hypothetical protein